MWKWAELSVLSRRRAEERCPRWALCPFCHLGGGGGWISPGCRCLCGRALVGVKEGKEMFALGTWLVLVFAPWCLLWTHSHTPTPYPFLLSRPHLLTCCCLSVHRKTFRVCSDWYSPQEGNRALEALGRRWGFWVFFVCCCCCCFAFVSQDEEGLAMISWLPGRLF